MDGPQDSVLEQLFAGVSELSKTLETSVVTVRKDLRLLEERQQLTRITGGAIPYQGPMHRPDGPAAGETLAALLEDGDCTILPLRETTALFTETVETTGLTAEPPIHDAA